MDFIPICRCTAPYPERFLALAAARCLITCFYVALYFLAVGHAQTVCIDQASQNLTKCYNTSTAVLLQQCTSDLLTYSLLPCLQQESDLRAQQRVLRILVPKVFPNTTLNLWAEGYRNATGVTIMYTQVDFLNVVPEVDYEVKANVSLMNHAGWLLDPSGISLVGSDGGLADLGPRINVDPNIDWNDITPFFRDRSSVFDRKIVAVPLDGDLLLMYYRADVLLKHNVSVPQTWEDFVTVAAAMNGTDFDGDGEPDYSVCMDRFTYCKTSFWIAAMAAPYIQYQGTSQGFFYNPATMEPLVNNSAMARVLEMYKELGLYSHPSTANGCYAASPLFTQGKCLLTVNWGDEFKADQMSNTSTVRRTVGVSRLPGSTHVLERSTGNLIACSEDLCPFADTTVLYDGTSKLVNRAPYSAFGGWTGAVSTLVSPELQDAAYRFWSYLTSPEVSLKSVTNPASGFDPYRGEHLKSEHWIHAGYEPNAVATFLAATEDGVKSGNAVLDIRIPSAGDTRVTVMIAMGLYLSGALDTYATLAYIQDGWRKTAAQSTKTPQLYRESIAWEAPVPPAAAAAVSVEQIWSRGKGTDDTAVIVASTIVGAVLLVLAACIAWAWRRRDTRRNMFGRITAPGATPATTLVITDIQDSTVLWESLPQDVMDAAIKEHHAVIRRLLLRHGGYESATEGDSFILAFHTAQDAVLFSTQLQQELLAASWPQDLLSSQLCEPAYAAFSSRSKDIVRTQSKSPVDDKGSIAAGVGSLAAGVGGLVDAISAVVPHKVEMVEEKNRAACTYRDLLLATWPTCSSTHEDAVLVFRGLRVRVGIHSGILDPQLVVFNSSVQRTQYTGEAMVAAKAVVDGAQGAMVLMSEATYKQLHMEGLGQKVLVLQCGSHTLKGAASPMDVYQVTAMDLAARLSRLGPIRSCRALDLGALEAPGGCMSIVFLSICGTQALLAWDAAVTRHSISLLHQMASTELAANNGYMVEQTDDLVLAAFQSAEAAALWSLTVIDRALYLPWPEDLLSHPLGEELVLQVALSQAPAAPAPPALPVNAPADITGGLAPEAADPPPEPEEPERAAPKVLLRGLRVKAGVDTGSASGGPHGTTGRITYRGRVMNRAARIASSAGSGQVLSSEDTYLDARNHPSLSAASVGRFQLKGLPDLMTLYQYSLAAPLGAHQLHAQASLEARVHLARVSTMARCPATPGTLRGSLEIN